MAKSTGTAKRSGPSRSDPTALGRGFKKRLQSKDVLLGGIVMEYVRPSIVKIYRNAGFDFIYAEVEHTLFLGPQFTDFVLSARDNGMPVIAKTAQLERAEVARLLEAGVVGVQLPRTETRQDVLTLLDYMKFPPKGTRAGAPCFGNTDYAMPADDRAWLKKADASTILVVHIETRRGFENAEQIITTPGVDMVYLGPYDFSISMGHPGQYDHPQMKQAMMKVLMLCRKHGVPFGTTASNRKAAAGLVKRGCRFFEIVDEMTLIGQGATDTVEGYRSIPGV